MMGTFGLSRASIELKVDPEGLREMFTLVIVEALQLKLPIITSELSRKNIRNEVPKKNLFETYMYNQRLQVTLRYCSISCI